MDDENQDLERPDRLLRAVDSPPWLKSIVTYAKTLSRNDWSFADVPPEESRGCYYYEYLRGTLTDVPGFQVAECDELRRLGAVAFSDDLDDPHSQIWDARERVNAILNLPAARLDDVYRLLRSPWPKQPWQDLSVDDRQRRLGNMDPVADEQTLLNLKAQTDVEVTAENIATNLSLMADFLISDKLENPSALPAANHGGEVVYVAGVFRAGVYEGHVLEMFKSRLAAYRDRNPHSLESRDLGRAGFKDRLMKLGALRVHCLQLAIERDIGETNAGERKWIDHLLRIALEENAQGGGRHTVPQYLRKKMANVAADALAELRHLFKSGPPEEI